MTSNYADFMGGFKSFYDLTENTTLLGKIIVFWFIPEGGTEQDMVAITKRIVGFTNIPNDVMLHLIEVDTSENPPTYEEQMEANGVQFIKLSTVLGDRGMAIMPLDNKIEKGEN